jgi:thiamine biosynthesis lipoprotein
MRRAHVSATLHQVLMVAREIAEWSQGLVVPSLAQLMHEIGYNRSFDAMTLRQPAETTAVVVPDWRGIQVRGRHITLPPHLHVDVAGVAKGWMAQQLVARLAPTNPVVLVQLGGDIVVAAPMNDPWCIAIDHPFAANPVAHIALAEGAVMTSSVYHRRWMRANRPVHHIIDPRSGSPAQSDVATATVIAADAAYAEAGAKVAVILGVHEGLTWLSARGLPALIVDHAGHVHTNEYWQPFVWPEVAPITTHEVHDDYNSRTNDYTARIDQA